MPETQVVAALEKNKYYTHQDLFYVNRHSFWAAGQDSFTAPPAQDQDMFQQLTNVEPVLQGILQRRRGYTLLSDFRTQTFGPSGLGFITTTGSGNAWSNISNILVQDGQVATATINQSFPYAQALQATNFGFNIPANMNIIGVGVTVVCAQSAGLSFAPFFSLELLSGGFQIGGSRAFTPPSGTIGSQTVGGSGDTWGNGLTPTQVNDPSFGVQLNPSSQLFFPVSTFDVDFISMTIFTSETPQFTRGYSFRSENLSLRELVWSSPSLVVATNETGGILLNPIFTPSVGATAPRMVLSRNYGYFADGVKQDYKKWDGTSNSNNLTNWGIDINNIGVNSTFGPNSPGTATDLGFVGGLTHQGPYPASQAAAVGAPDPNHVTWNNPMGVTTPGGFTSTFSPIASFGGQTLPLQMTAFQGGGQPFNLPSGAVVTGIVAQISRFGSANSLNDKSVMLLSGGTAVGNNRASAPVWAPTATTVTYGSASDLWGTTWTPTQINDPSFGVQLIVQNNATNQANATVNAFVNISVYYTAPPTTTWTNPNNIQFQDGLVATSPTPSSALQATNFGFSGIPSTVQIIGVQVDMKVATNGNPVTIQPVLLNEGFPTGLTKTGSTNSTSLGFLSFGGPADLWGTSFQSVFINGVAGFGVQFNVTSALGAVVSVDYVQLTIFTEAGPLTATPSGFGNITLLSGRTYFYAFQNSRTGHTSDISPPSLSTGPLTSQQVTLTNIPTNVDPQVDTTLILATLDGSDQTLLFFVAAIANGTNTYVDNTPDTLSTTVTSGPSLETSNIYQQTDEFGFLHGVANNKLPPTGTFPVKHKGRLYMGSGHILYFSKNLDDVTTSTGLTTGKWEEAWPATNQIDISTRAETLQALLSDGETLWLGTERAIRRLIGDSPQNFQEPEIQFNETGVLNQEVWQVVFYEGQPVGTAWLTPDFRVIASDFNSYQDIGAPIQDVLNSINPAAAQAAHAAFVSQGPADYYMLYIPTGSNTVPDTICVYNLRTKRWFIWKPTDQITASLFNISQFGTPQWLFASASGVVDFWDNTTLLDRNGDPTTSGVAYAVTMQTAWLDMGDYNIRKFVNQIIPTTADQGALAIRVDGASNELDFNSPLSVVPLTTVIPAAIPTDVFVPLASGPSHNRAFQFTFVSPANTIKNVLTGFAIEAGQFHRY